MEHRSVGGTELLFLFNFENFQSLLSTHNDSFDCSMWTPLLPQCIFLNLGWKPFGIAVIGLWVWSVGSGFIPKAVSFPRSKLLSGFQMYSR